ncbi:hypothetical protein [uncultured Dokdonia sp.]|uniref:hypothetical protein n=1 Tax=uncultured Dokdonia sp. TaxID=575653 RepID=UPI002630C07E|nr:hypothetical protein [uncultured Dokdonia sp.]
MKKLIFLIVFIFINITMSYGQVGVGTTTPRAALEISNTTNGGVLVPKYALSGNDDTSTVTNPQGTALEIGTVVFNTTQVTGTNGLEVGFVYWDGAVWTSIMPRTQIMQRSFSSNTLTSSTVTPFNYDTELFSNIDGASFSGTTVTLPRGVYELTATIRVNERVSVDYQARVNGTNSGSIGTSSAASFNSDAGSYSPVSSVFEITAASGTVDFVIINSFAQGSGNVSDGITVLSGQCYMTIKKL